MLNSNDSRVSEFEMDFQKVSAVVENINIDGIQRTDAKFIRDQVKLLHKARTFTELLNYAKMTKLHLQDLDIFSDIGVVIDVAKGPADPNRRNRYDVTFMVKEKGRVGGSVFTTCDLNNKVNIVFTGKCPNILGKGEKLDAQWNWGLGSTTGRHVCFSKPVSGYPRTRFSFGGYDACNEDEVCFIKEVDRGIFTDFRLPSRLGTHLFRWEGIWRHVAPAEKATTISNELREECGHSIKSALSHTLEHDTRDSRIFPSEGLFARFRQELALKDLAGSRQYNEMNAHHLNHELQMSMARQLPLGLVVEGSIAAGLIKSLQPSGKIHFPDRYFVGGPLNLRGFRNRCLGPCSEDSVQSPTGAHTYGVASLHFYSPLPFLGTEGFPGNFRLHAFGQAGGASNTSISEWVEAGESVTGCLERWSKLARISVGAGIAFQFAGVARMELNYCLPIQAQASDKIAPGIQFGLGINYL